MEVCGREFGEEREAYAGGGAGEERGEDDAGTLVAGGEEDGVALAAERVGAADGIGCGEEFAERGRRGDQAIEAGVVAEDTKGETAGGGGDAGAGDRGVDRGDERRGVNRSAQGEGVLEEEEVGDVGQVGLAGVDQALEDAEVDEGGGFECGSDGSSRIPRVCADSRSKTCGEDVPLCEICDRSCEYRSKFPPGKTEGRANATAVRLPIAAARHLTSCSGPFHHR